MRRQFVAGVAGPFEPPSGACWHQLDDLVRQPVDLLLLLVDGRMFSWSSRSSVKLALISRLSRRWRMLVNRWRRTEASDHLTQAHHAFSDLVHIGRGEANDRRKVAWSGIGAEERRAGHKGHALLDGMLGQHVAIGHLAARTRECPRKRTALGCTNFDIAQLAAQRASPMAWARSAYLLARVGCVPDMRSLEVLRGVACTKVLVLCVAELLAHGGLGQQFGRNFDEPRADRAEGSMLPQWATNQSREPGTLPSLSASILGGGASPKRSP